MRTNYRQLTGNRDVASWSVARGRFMTRREKKVRPTRPTTSMAHGGAGPAAVGWANGP